MKQIQEQKYTAGEAATALNIPLGTIRIWAKREHLLPEAQEREGQWRGYTRYDVAYFAVLALLTPRFQRIREAVAVLESLRRTTEEQINYWHSLVDSAVNNADEYLFVKLYTFKGVPEIET